MKKLFLAAAIFLSATALYSCQNKSESTAAAVAIDDPKTVLTNFFDALSKADVESAKKLATPESELILNMAGSRLQQNKEMLAKYDKSKVTFGEPKISGDSAIVPVTSQSSSADFLLKKTDGKWKVDFTLNSMMGLNMDKIKERQGSRGLEKLKSMNVDSLAKEMLRKNDSAKKELEKMK